MIKTIFFDIGGVLLEIYPERALQFWADSTDLSLEQVKRSFSKDVHDAYEKGFLSDREYFTAVRDTLPQPCCLKESDFWRGWSLLLGEETKVSLLLKHLSKSHSLWLLSNTNPKHLRNELESRVSFLSHIEGAVYSFDSGARKPEPAIYEKALIEAKTKAQEALFIDDMDINIKAAESLGFKTIHYQGFDSLLNALADLNIYFPSDIVDDRDTVESHL